MKEEYQIKYAEFLELKRSGAITDKTVGSLIADFAQYFSECNLNMADAQIQYDRLYSKNIQSNDEGGKPMSAAKAEVLTKGSEEGGTLTLMKTHVGNTEQIINALKSLQKALGNEFSHMSLS